MVSMSMGPGPRIYVWWVVMIPNRYHVNNPHLPAEVEDTYGEYVTTSDEVAANATYRRLRRGRWVPAGAVRWGLYGADGWKPALDEGESLGLSEWLERQSNDAADAVRAVLRREARAVDE